MGGLAARLLLGLGALAITAEAAHALSPVDCVAIDMDFADGKAQKTCQDGDASSGLFRATEQVLVVEGQLFRLCAPP
jgi:hypothetical protein